MTSRIANNKLAAFYLQSTRTMRTLNYPDLAKRQFSAGGGTPPGGSTAHECRRALILTLK
jgi:hypothetical protein